MTLHDSYLMKYTKMPHIERLKMLIVTHSTTVVFFNALRPSEEQMELPYNSNNGWLKLSSLTVAPSTQKRE